MDEFQSTTHMSPYRTRSRKSSTLTEENIASHNDSPKETRRVTRRMSSDNSIVMTPMPIRRSKRSPSVKSEDAPIKPKFVVAQENTVVEENEVSEEDESLQPPVIVPNKTEGLLDSQIATDILYETDPKFAPTASTGLDPKLIQNEIEHLNKSVVLEDGLSIDAFQEKELRSQQIVSPSIAEQAPAPPVLENVIEHLNKSFVLDDEMGTDTSGEKELKIEQNISTSIAEISPAPTVFENETENLNKNVVLEDKMGTDVTGEKELRIEQDISTTTAEKSPAPTAFESETEHFNENVLKDEMGTAASVKKDLKIEQNISTSTAEISPAPAVFENETENLNKNVVLEDKMGTDASGEVELRIEEDISTTTAEKSPAPTALENETEHLNENVVLKDEMGTDASVEKELKIEQNILTSTAEKSTAPTVFESKTENLIKNVLEDKMGTDASGEKKLKIEHDISTTTAEEFQVFENETEHFNKKVLKDDIGTGPSGKKELKIEQVISTTEQSPAPVINGNKMDGCSVVLEDEMENHVTLAQSSSEDIELPKSQVMASSETLILLEQSKTLPITETKLNEINCEGVEYPKYCENSTNCKSDEEPIDNLSVAALSLAKPLTKNDEFIEHVASNKSNEENENDSRNKILYNEAVETNEEDFMESDELKYLEENKISKHTISLASDTNTEKIDDCSDFSFVVADSEVDRFDDTEDDVEISNDRELENSSQQKGLAVLKKSPGITLSTKESNKKQPDSFFGDEQMSSNEILKLDSSKFNISKENTRNESDVTPDTVKNVADYPKKGLSDELISFHNATNAKETIKISNDHKSRKAKSMSTSKISTKKMSNCIQNEQQNYNETLARCNDYMQAINERKRLEKLENHNIKVEKMQKLKRKKERKLEARKKKEARRAASLEDQERHKKEKKKKVDENKDVDNMKAIEKALTFSNLLLTTSKKLPVESKVRSKVLNDNKLVPKKRKLQSSNDCNEIKKRKVLQILKTSEPAIINKKIKDTPTEKISAKPAGFTVYANSTKAKKNTAEREKYGNQKVKVKKELLKPQWTSAGIFDVSDILPRHQILSVAATTQFKVSSLAGENRKAKSFNDFIEKSMYNPRIPRESSEMLLSRKQLERKLRG